MKKKKLKKKIIVIPFVCIVALSGIIGTVFLRSQSGSAVKVVSVTELQASSYFSDNSIYSYGKLSEGSLQAVKTNKDSEIKVSKYKVSQGDKVKKGDILVEYDVSSLQLNVDTQETYLSIVENNIKIAENKLKKLKNLQPSENLPKVTEIVEDMTEYFEEPTEIFSEEMPAEETTEFISEKFEYTKIINIDTEPYIGDGSETNPYIFEIGVDSIVSKKYMEYLSGIELKKSAEETTQKATEGVTEKNTTEVATETDNSTNYKYAMFNVYDECKKIICRWFVDGSEITEEYIADWTPMSGITMADDGSIRIKQGVSPFATLITYIADTSQENDYSAYIENSDVYENIDDYFNSIDQSEIDNNFIHSYIKDDYIPDNISDYNVNDFNNSVENNSNIDENYIYSKSELDEMISSAESEIEQLKFNKRKIEIDLSRAKNSLKNGNETAIIDGTVTFVAKSDKQAEQKGYYVIVSNETSTSITCTVSSKDLQNISEGTTATVSYDLKNDSNDDILEGKECKGTVTAISDTISTNTNIPGNTFSDDTNEYYDVQLILDESISTSEDDTLLVEFDVKTDNKSIWISSVFVRYENNKGYVMVANENDILEKRYVEIGTILFGDFIEIKSGLSKNENLAIPYGKAKEGASTILVDYSSIESGLLI